MLFNTFISNITALKEVPLQGKTAHLLMAPPGREIFLELQDYSIHNPRKAAVLSLFYPKDKQTYVLLIVRSQYPGIHSAQVSFPGGKSETIDASLEQTALRETFEEVGIPAHQIEVIKPWSEIYVPPSNFMISPFMGISYEPIIPQIDTREVSRLIELPVAALLDENLISAIQRKTSYAGTIDVPAFVFENDVIWGATAMILSEIKETLKMMP